MASVVLYGDTSGAITVSAPAVAGTNTITFPALTGIPAVSAAALTSGRIPYATTGGAITDSANLTFNGSTLAVTGTVNASTAVSVGTSVAAAGEIRLKVGQSIAYRNVGNTVDLNLVSIGAGNILTFGSNDQGHIYHNVSTGQSHYKQVNGSTVTTTSSTGLAVTGALSTTDAVTIATANAVGTGGDAIVGKTSTSTNDWLLGNYGYSFASAGQLSLGSISNIPLVLATNNAERMRIRASGAVCINQTTAAGGADVPSLSVKSTTAADQAINVWNSATSGTRWYLYFGVGASFTATGSITSDGSTTAYNTTSDYRLKENVQPMVGALARVMALRPVSYTWRANGGSGEGFIAHELAKVCPQAVVGEKDELDDEGNPVYQGIDTSFLIATLTAAIQEIKAEFDAYKAAHP
jgi:hypothetical protein